MYPSLLRDRLFPVALGPTYGRLVVPALVDFARSSGVIARVTVRTNVPEYPQRTPQGVRYPVGMWTACLAGPELLALHDTPGHGEILECHQCATYAMGAPFKRAMECLLEARARASDREEKTFCKLLANSVAGRLAMRVGGWKRCADLDGLQQWGEEWVQSATGGDGRRYRWILGMCWVFDPEKEARGPHTSAFAYLTAYGRVMMREIRDLCPPKSVYAQHTDGLYCNWEALRSLSAAGKFRAKGAGALRLVASACSARFYGAAHYKFGCEWTLAGYSSAHVSEDKGLVYVSRDPSFFGARHQSAPDRVFRSRVAIPIPTDAAGCEIGEDGWALPALARPRKREQ